MGKKSKSNSPKKTATPTKLTKIQPGTHYGHGSSTPSLPPSPPEFPTGALTSLFFTTLLAVFLSNHPLFVSIRERIHPFPPLNIPSISSIPSSASPASPASPDSAGGVGGVGADVLVSSNNKLNKSETNRDTRETRETRELTPIALKEATGSTRSATGNAVEKGGMTGCADLVSTDRFGPFSFCQIAVTAPELNPSFGDFCFNEKEGRKLCHCSCKLLLGNKFTQQNTDSTDSTDSTENKDSVSLNATRSLSQEQAQDQKEPTSIQSTPSIGPLWWIRSQPYALSPFLLHHPGGHRYLSYTADTDITYMFESHHMGEGMERALGILEYYRLRVDGVDGVDGMDRVDGVGAGDVRDVDRSDGKDVGIKEILEMNERVVDRYLERSPTLRKYLVPTVNHQHINNSHNSHNSNNSHSSNSNMDKKKKKLQEKDTQQSQQRQQIQQQQRHHESKRYIALREAIAQTFSYEELKQPTTEYNFIVAFVLFGYLYCLYKCFTLDSSARKIYASSGGIKGGMKASFQSKILYHTLLGIFTIWNVALAHNGVHLTAQKNNTSLGRWLESALMMTWLDSPFHWMYWHCQTHHPYTNTRWDLDWGALGIMNGIWSDLVVGHGNGGIGGGGGGIGGVMSTVKSGAATLLWFIAPLIGLPIDLNTWALSNTISPLGPVYLTPIERYSTLIVMGSIFLLGCYYRGWRGWNGWLVWYAYTYLVMMTYVFWMIQAGHMQGHLGTDGDGNLMEREEFLRRLPMSGNGTSSTLEGFYPLADGQSLYQHLNDWGEYQLRTTAGWSTHSSLTLVGLPSLLLNYQPAHHLFPAVHHSKLYKLYPLMEEYYPGLVNDKRGLGSLIWGSVGTMAGDWFVDREESV